MNETLENILRHIAVFFVSAFIIAVAAVIMILFVRWAIPAGYRLIEFINTIT